MPPSMRWSVPSSAKKRAAIAPITTQDTAVGRKNTVRKSLHPGRWVESRNAITSGIPIATGTASSSMALFFSTCWKSGLCNRREYVLVPTHVAVRPSHCVKL